MTKSAITNLMSAGLAEANPHTQVTAFNSAAQRKPQLNVINNLMSAGLAEATPNTQVTAFNSVTTRKAA